MIEYKNKHDAKRKTWQKDAIVMDSKHLIMKLIMTNVRKFPYWSNEPCPSL